MVHGKPMKKQCKKPFFLNKSEGGTTKGRKKQNRKKGKIDYNSFSFR